MGPHEMALGGRGTERAIIGHTKLQILFKDMTRVTRVVGHETAIGDAISAIGP